LKETDQLEDQDEENISMDLKETWDGRGGLDFDWMVGVDLILTGTIGGFL
jgi:hypothetical protein